MDGSNIPIDGEVEADGKQIVNSLPNWTFGSGVAARFAAHDQQAKFTEKTRAFIWPPWLW